MTTRPRILVIDDETSLSTALRRALIRDVDVVVCDGGHDAVATLLADDQFDLVLCDIMMPDITGIEVYERVVATKPTLGARFVFMTGGTFTPEVRKFLDRAGNARLQKPFELEPLRRLIHDHASIGQ